MFTRYTFNTLYTRPHHIPVKLTIFSVYSKVVTITPHVYSISTNDIYSDSDSRSACDCKHLFPAISWFPCWSIGPIISPLFANKIYCLKWTEYCVIHFSLPIVNVRCFYYSMTTKPLESYRMGVLMTFSVCRQCFFTIIYPSEILTQSMIFVTE